MQVISPLTHGYLDLTLNQISEPSIMPRSWIFQHRDGPRTMPQLLEFHHLKVFL